MVSSNGFVFPVNPSGTYQVNPDCTGLFHLSLPQVSQSISSLWFWADNWGKSGGYTTAYESRFTATCDGTSETRKRRCARSSRSTP